MSHAAERDNSERKTDGPHTTATAGPCCLHLLSPSRKDNSSDEPNLHSLPPGHRNTGIYLTVLYMLCLSPNLTCYALLEYGLTSQGLTYFNSSLLKPIA